MKDNKNFKSTFDIIKEISAVWEDLDDITQANVSNLLGGKRNANVIQALMTNFKDAEAAMQTASNAAGSALKENEQYLDSIQGKLDIMKGKFQELAMQIVGSDLVKWVVDIGNGTLNVLNNMQRLHALLPMIGGAFAAIIATVAKARAAAGAGGLLAKLGGLLTGSSIPIVGTIMLVATAIAGVVAAVNHLSQAQQRAIEQVDQLSAAYADNEAEYNRNSAALDALSGRYHELANKTELTAEEQQEYKSILQQIIDISPSVVSGYDSEHNALLKYKDAITGAREELDKLHAEQQKEYFSKAEENWETWQGELNTNRDDFSETARATIEDFYKEVQDAADDVFRDDNYMRNLLLENVAKIFGAYDESNSTHGYHEFHAWLQNLTDQELRSVSEHMDDYVAQVSNLNNNVFGRVFSQDLMQSWESSIVDTLWSAASEMDKPLDKMSQYMQDWIKYQDDAGKEWAEGLTNKPWYDDLVNALPTLIDENDVFKTQAQIKEYAAGLREIDNSAPVQNLYKMADAFKEGKVSAEEYNAAIDELDVEPKIAELEQQIADETAKAIPNPFAIMEWQQQLDELTGNRSVIGSLVEYFRSIVGGVEATGESAEEAKKPIEDLSKALEKFSSNQKILDSAKNEMKSGGLSIDTVKSIKDALSAGENLNDYLYTENGLIKLNTEAWEQRNRVLLENDIAAKEASIAELQQKIADEAAKPIQNPFAIQEWQKQLDDLVNEVEIDKAILNEPLNLSNMFSQVKDVESKANVLTSALDKVKNKTLIDWGELAAQYPELSEIDGLFAIDTLEGQEQALNSLLSQCQEDYKQILTTQIESLGAIRRGMIEDGKDVTGITAVINNLKTLWSGDGLKLETGGKTLPEQLTDAMSKASKYADTLKSSMDGIDFGEWQQLREVFGEDWQSYLAPDGKSLNSAKMYTEIINELIAKGASKEVLDSFREMWFAIGGDGNADKAVEGIEHLTTAMDELAGANELLKGLQSGKGNPIDYIDQLLELAKGGHIDIASIFGADGKIDFASASSAVQNYMNSLLSWDSVKAMNIPGMTEEITAALREQVLAANEAEQSVTTLKDAISGINTANGFLSNIRAYEKTGEGDVLSMITQAAELAEREGFKINDFFTIVGDNVQWNSDAVVRWAQSWISSIDGIDGVTEEFLNKQIQAMSQAERMSAALSEATTITQVGYTAGPSSQITYDQYQELIGISKQYAYAVEYNNGILTLNKAVFDDVTDSIIANKLAEIEAAKQAVIMGDEYQRLIKEINAGKTLSDDDRQLFTNLNANIMGFEVLKQQIEGATAAYQKFLNADSATDSTQYEAGQKALQVIKDTLSDPKSDAYGKIGRQEYKEAVKFLIDPEIEVNSAEWNAQMKQLGRWFTDGDKGIKQFWTDLQSNGFIDSNNQLTGSVEAMAESLGTNVNVVCALLDQLSLYLEEPIKQENGEIFDSKSILEGKDALDQAGTAAKNASENVGDVSTEAEEASTSLETIGQKIEDAKSAIDELATKEVTMDTSSAATKLGQLSTSLVKIMNQVNKLASKTVNIKVNYSTSGGVPRFTAVSGYGYSAAPGTLGAPGGKTLVGELGRKLFCVGIW